MIESKNKSPANIFKILKKYKPQNKSVEKKVTSYWTKKSIELSSYIYENLLQENSFILDPFLGSGTSLFGIQNCKKKMKFIGVELNELPLKFIDFNLKRMDIEEFQRFKNQFKVFEVKNKSCYEYYTKKNKEKFYFSKVLIDIENGQLIPKEFKVFNKALEPMILNKSKNKLIFEEFKKMYIDRNIDRARKGFTDNFSLETNTRIAIKKNMKISDLFSPTNFHLLNKFKQFSKSNENLKILLSLVLHLCKLTDLKSQSQFPYWFPRKNALDRNILELMSKKLFFLEKNLMRRQKELFENNKLFRSPSFENLKKQKHSSYMTIRKPIQKLNNLDLPDNSIDFLITDPPYFDQVPYSEYLELWRYFTNFKNNFKDEIVQTDKLSLTKDREKYLSDLKEGFKVISKKLKKDAFALIFFKDSKLSNISSFLKILNECNLTYEGQIHISKKKHTYKQNTSKLSTVIGDCLFLFKKNTKRQIIPIKKYNESEIRKIVIKFIYNYLELKKSASIGEIFDNGLIWELFTAGQLEHIKSVQFLMKIIKDEFFISNRNGTISLETE